LKKIFNLKVVRITNKRYQQIFEGQANSVHGNSYQPKCKMCNKVQKIMEYFEKIVNFSNIRTIAGQKDK